MRIVRLSDASIDAAAKEAAGILRAGGIVLYPTDTLYGLAVDAGNRAAIRLLRELKGREQKKPMSVIVRDAAAIAEYATLDEAAALVADRFLPGALTLVLPANKNIPDELTLNGTIGIRIPDHPFTASLAKAFGKPYTATSANRAGLPTPSDAQAILAQFGHLAHDIALVVDAGTIEGGTPSTVVSFIDGIPHVLREGAISREALGLA